MSEPSVVLQKIVPNPNSYIEANVPKELLEMRCLAPDRGAKTARPLRQ